MVRAQDAEHAKRQAEVEVEELKVRYEEAKKSLESWRKKGLGGNADEYEALRVSFRLRRQLFSSIHFLKGKIKLTDDLSVIENCHLHSMQQEF